MKRVRLLRLCGVVLCVLPWTVYAITLGDGERTRVTLAQGAIDQLRVIGDRIQTLRGIPTEVEVMLDPLLGDAYLTVKNEKPFTVFITTEKKRRYVLDCLPIEGIPATVIVIEAPPLVPTAPPPSIQQWDVMPFLRELQEAVNTLARKKPPSIPNESPIRHQATRVLLIKKQHGALLGKVYWVTSLQGLAQPLSATDSLLLRTISRAPQRLRSAFYVVEVSYV